MPMIHKKTRVSLLLALLALGVSVGAALVRKVPTTRPDQVVDQGIKLGKGLQQLQGSVKLPNSVSLHVGEKLQEQIEKVFSEKTR